MPKKKYAEYEYIHFNRKITNKKMMRIIRLRAEQWEVSNADAIFRILETAILSPEKLITLYGGLTTK